MKTLRYLTMAVASFMLTACMDGEESFFNYEFNEWDEPAVAIPPYGNNNINEENIITIAQLKSHPTYKDAIANSGVQLVNEDLKLRLTVTGNDLGGNLYKQFAAEDATGAVIIAVNQGGICGYLAEGQEIIVDLQGLYVGGYGKQFQIGAPYKETQVGRMNKDIWNSHFRIMGQPKAVSPVDFDDVKGDIEANAGRLVVLKNVTFTNANGSVTLADTIYGSKSGGNYYAQKIDGYNNVIVRTSTYADFAQKKLPYNTETNQKVPCTIVGIATRFNNDWQIMIRKSDDINF